MTTRKQFSSFSELIADATVPVLISFYAPWCGYCKSFAPILEQVKTQMGDRIQVIRINSEQYPKLASQHQVKSLPTTLLFIDGELAGRVKGVMQINELIPYLTKLISN